MSTSTATSTSTSTFIVERRGKYPGVKLHLDADDCQGLLDIEAQCRAWLKNNGSVPRSIRDAVTYAKRTAKAIRGLLVEQPDLLTERTPAQIDAELHEEAKKAQMKLARKAGGEAWKDAATKFLVILTPTGAVQATYKKAFAEYAHWGEFVAEAMIPAHVPLIIRSIAAQTVAA